MKFGVEIEGFSEESIFDEVIKPACRDLHFDVGADGSIIINGEFENPVDFEIKTKVYKKEELNQFIADVKTFYSEVFVNGSCGLHIHVSFDDMVNYYKILSWDFVNSFQEKYRKLFTEPTEVNRITHRYCRFYADEATFNEEIKRQLRNTSKGDYRRYSVNFNSFNSLKTIEFRIFPACKSIERMESYLTFLLKFIAKYCNKRIKREVITGSAKFRSERIKKIVLNGDEICIT